MKSLHIVGAALLMSLVCNIAYSCSCATGTPAMEFNQAKSVFIGKMLSGTELLSHKDEKGKVWTAEAGNVRFMIEEVFKGDLQGEVVIEVNSMKGTSCGDYGLKRGVQYLVYAYAGGKLDNALYTGVCTRTSPIDGNRVKEDLTFLRNLPAPGTGGNLEGHIWADLRKGGATPLPNVKVNIRREDGTVISVSTDEKGFFEAKKIKAGKYTVEPEFPKNYVSERKPPEVLVADRGTASVGFEAYLNGLVTGKIVDEAGKGYNYSFLHLVEKGSTEKRTDVYGGSTGEDGAFQVFGVPPGDYVLYAELRGRDYNDNKKYYYPGTFERAKASVINVGLGDKAEGLEFTLPKGFKICLIEGQVLWDNGKPAANAEVMLLCPKSDKPNGMVIEFSPTSVRTDEDGRFQLESFTSENYQLEARASKPGATKREVVEVHSPANSFSPKGDVKGLKLVLSGKGFSANSCK